MSASNSPRSPASPGALAELLVSAAAELSGPTGRVDLAPAGIPLRGGRLHLSRLRSALPVGEALEVAAGFATACWIGAAGAPSPELGRLAYRSQTRIDGRGRLMLDRRTRIWLAVADINSFDVVTLAAPEGGVVVVPVEDFARRWEVLCK